VIDQGGLAAFRRDGYVVARRGWSAAEIAELSERFERLRLAGERVPGHFEPDPTSPDPLRRTPRVLLCHQFCELSRSFLLDARVEETLRLLMGEEPLAVNSMYYYKPPGSRGQTFHQDNFYLLVEPATCLTVWTAVDRCDTDNGGLYLCPGTQHLPTACPELANEAESFTTHLVRPPRDAPPVPVALEPGDVLFFNGQMIHGSGPNHSSRWRRSFICHYAPASSSQVNDYYEVVDFQNTPQPGIASSGAGGPCGEELLPDGSPRPEVPWRFEDAVAAGFTQAEPGVVPFPGAKRRPEGPTGGA
jgi:phytanoyl-CoA hydroxylase